MKIMSLKSDLIINLKNLPGKKSSRKVVVIFVDDYGSIRTRSEEARQLLLKAGVPMDANRYSRFDTLCDTEDMQMLYEVLTSVKDCRGRSACFTPFANPANPDFGKIRESGVAKYYREPFTETLLRYGKDYDGVYDLWKQVIEEGIFRPEYHGTEHVNVWKLMKALQEGHKSTRLAFDVECVAVPPIQGEQAMKKDTAVFDIEHAEQNTQLIEDVKVGQQLFEELLGYRSLLFTPGANLYSPAIHSALVAEGIRYISVNRYFPYPLGDGKYVKKFHWNGQKEQTGMQFIIRNCVFEPTGESGALNMNAKDICLKNVDAALRWHNPAIISTHRVNFAGHLDKEHRNHSLDQLRSLLQKIVKRHPDVEFMSGDEMVRTIY